MKPFRAIDQRLLALSDAIVDKAWHHLGITRRTIVWVVMVFWIATSELLQIVTYMKPDWFMVFLQIYIILMQIWQDRRVYGMSAETRAAYLLARREEAFAVGLRYFTIGFLSFQIILDMISKRQHLLLSVTEGMGWLLYLYFDYSLDVLGPRKKREKKPVTSPVVFGRLQTT